MALVVQKYGGTSVGDLERIKNVASRVLRTKNQGNQVVVVVSAMAGETDKLIRLAKQITSTPNERELDVLVATGEQVSIALLAMTLRAMGTDAKSYLAFQIKLATDSAFGRARIMGIESDKILTDLKEGRIVVIAGFQGVDESDNITTLGRGGSDTTAVAIAAALKADCLRNIHRRRTESTRRTPTSVPGTKATQASLTTKCLKWQVSARKSFTIRSVEFAKNTMFPFTYGHRSTTIPERSSARRTKKWKGSSYPASRTTRTRLRYKSCRSLTPGGRGKPLPAGRGRQHRRRHDHPDVQHGQGVRGYGLYG